MLLVVAHIAVRVLARGADATLLPLAALLHGIGFVMITRLDEKLAGLQTTWSIIAIAAFVATLFVVQRATDLARYKWVLFLVGAGLARAADGAGRRAPASAAPASGCSLGPINFQPGEFAKLALAIFFAAYLAETRELIAAGTWKIGPIRLPEPQYILSLAHRLGLRRAGHGRREGPRLVAAVLHAVRGDAVGRHRSDSSTWSPASGLFAGRRYVAWQIFGHVQTRVDIWLDPWADPLDDGYQIVQALYGLSDGGIVGTGLGLGNPSKVPEAQNDFIFASIAEELGLVGAAAMLMAYLLLIGAGLRVAMRTENAFEKLLAVGLTTIVGIQAFIIVGGVIKVVPLTGITLPFVSYGGSSLLANYVLLALLIRLSDSSARRRGELPDDPTPGERWAAWKLNRAARKAGTAEAVS